MNEFKIELMLCSGIFEYQSADIFKRYKNLFYLGPEYKNIKKNDWVEYYIKYSDYCKLYLKIGKEIEILMGGKKDKYYSLGLFLDRELKFVIDLVYPCEDPSELINLVSMLFSNNFPANILKEDYFSFRIEHQNDNVINFIDSRNKEVLSNLDAKKFKTELNKINSEVNKIISKI